MGGGVGGLEAAALVDRHVDDDRSGLHLLDHFAVTSFGAAAPGMSTPPITRSAAAPAIRPSRGSRKRSDRGAEFSHQPAQCRHSCRDVTDGAEPSAMRAALAPTMPPPDDHVRRRHAGHTAQQHAPSAFGFLQAVGPDLDRHATGHFATWAPAKAGRRSDR